MPKNFLYILFACLLLPGSRGFAQSPEAMQSLKEIAVPVTINPDSLNDLLPLKATLQNKRIVGMGEATHGTHDFFTMKHKMLEFLVKEMGYRVFAIEANFTECRAVNNYVLYGKGDANEVIAGMYFWTWNTDEVKKMVNWMRDYNKGKAYADQVKFYGFDMQIDKVARELVIAKLKQLDSTYFQTHFKALEANVANKKNYTNAHQDSVTALLKTVKIYLAEQDNRLLKLYTRNEIDYLMRDVELIGQCLGQKTLENTGGMIGRWRDKMMAENISWILEHEGSSTRMMLWAHNGHISKIKSCMGGFLAEKYNGDYYPIGFDFKQGSFRALDLYSRKLENFTVAEAKDKSTGKAFAQLGMTVFFVDITGVVKSKSPARPLFTKLMASRTIGAVFSPPIEKNYYTNSPLSQQFDGVIFMNDVTTAIPISSSNELPPF